MLESKIVKLYEEGKSIREVCKELNTYISKVYSVLKKHDKLRSKSEMQKMALASGKVKHPTKGKVRKESTKLKISKSMGKYWDALTEEEKEVYAKLSKERWDNKTDKEKAAFQKAGILAIRKSAETGSKMEFFVIDNLKKAGFNTLHHKKNFLANVNLEVDVLVPEIKTVIEVDGPSHQKPIWGQEAFAKRQNLDSEKNGLLLNNGYIVIRLKFNDEAQSLYNRTKAMNELVNLLNDIKKDFPPVGERFHEIFV